MGKASRDKGARGEREWRDVLRAHGYDAARGCQHAGGFDSPDVKGELDDRVSFEVKRTERLALWAAVDQACEDAGDRVPVVVHRPNRRGWIAVLRGEDFMALLRAVHPPKEE